VYHDGYLAGSGIKWKFMTKDFAQLKNLMKLASLQEFQQIMALYITVKKNMSAGKKVEFDLERFAKNISPGYIVSKINFLLEKTNKTAGKREMNYEKTKL
jgi:hypothetical protein